jgi:hypothetical protein
MSAPPFAMDQEQLRSRSLDEVVHVFRPLSFLSVSCDELKRLQSPGTCVQEVYMISKFKQTLLCRKTIISTVKLLSIGIYIIVRAISTCISHTASGVVRFSRCRNLRRGRRW